MPTYISLVQFTDKGIQAVKETTHRVSDWAVKVKPMGVNIKDMYWTLGHYKWIRGRALIFDISLRGR